MLESKTREIIVKLLDAYALRQQVLSDNIANATTPAFKRSDVTFEYEMQRALDNVGQAEMPARVSDARHIPFNIAADYKDVEPKVTLEYETSYLNNGANVDIDREMGELAKNGMRYQMFTQLLGGKFRGLNRLIGSA